MSPVVFFMLDGVRPDALLAARCPNLAGIRARGASTLTATSVMPCITLPCHTSIFHSVPPARHGITQNLWTPMARPVPGLVEVLRAAGRRAAFFYNWEPLRDLSRPENLSHAFFTDSQHDPAGDDLVADAALNYLARAQADFMFVYFGTVDAVGHDSGWLSPEYLAQLERVDAQVGRVLAALPPDTALLVQADHGGHDRNHGENVPEDMTVPWMAAGPGVRAGHAIQAPVNLIDTAPTLARLLALTPPAAWEGRCPAEIFAEPAA
ncbi:MAG: alkaline phosphatase family protein [Anaerolineales bacterium]|nr:alkaline phosphatase family protein [Anaerolineales bacterium]